MFPPPIPTAAPSSPAPSAAPENGTPSTPVACAGDAPSAPATCAGAAPAASAALSGITPAAPEAPAGAAPSPLAAGENGAPSAPATCCGEAFALSAARKATALSAPAALAAAASVSPGTKESAAPSVSAGSRDGAAPAPSETFEGVPLALFRVRENAIPAVSSACKGVVPPAPAGSRDSASACSAGGAPVLPEAREDGGAGRAGWRAREASALKAVFLRAAFPRAGRARAAGRSVSRETFRFSGRPFFSARFPSRLLAVLAAMALAVTCVGCSGANGTAATVNGTAIPEQAVTDYVQSLRAAQGLEDGAAWKAYLEDSGQTSEGVRDQVIDVLVSREIMRQGASELGVRVTGEELDEAVAVKRRTYESDEQWRAALAAAGLDEKSFREETELDLLSAKVTQALAEDPSLAYEATRDTDDSAYDKVGDAASGAGDAVQDEAALESARTQAALAWIADLRARADITVSPFPNGLPY